ncbi:metalloregulator ArsR/SmtB family transcription factor [Pseudonocardia sp. MH-G8]|uniref:helix-turn-helix transcriptional regulator n=1 Tax=Pseudonocardia sp. MH-G8 TaxID=1854588 RepID=UPI000BA04868|nr:helix-turn-helix domain-containing protein [Pseudonocardia sp. MH-G8]OZM76718.1 transcriptional regulator [Pseudonocardia sp. MH-G8]
MAESREAGGRRREVLALLRASASPLSIAEIADHLQVHPNTVRFHLDALTGTGQVERADTAPAGPGRPPLVFRARPGMDATGPRNYRLLAGVLAGGIAAGPDPAAVAVEAGRRWGAQLAEPQRTRTAASPDGGVAWLVALLGDLGFAPEWPMPEGTEQIGLRHCPFLEVAGNAPDVVCRVHLGLMQGAMAALDAPVRVDTLEPFVAPDLCLARLSVPARGEDRNR